MKILFFGTPEIAVPSLQKVHTIFSVVGVVSQPDKPSGRHLRITPPPIKIESEKLGIPVFQPEKLNDTTFIQKLRELQPDLGVVVAYGRFLKEELLSLPTLGYTINLHPSLLPRWRGPSPIQTAILEGDTETGVTIMKISKDMDAGDILLQKTTQIDIDETAEELTKRLSLIGADLLIEAIQLIAKNKAVFTPQDHTKATYCHLIEKKHGIIHWDLPALNIHNCVRGCLPWPIAFTKFKNEIIRIYKTELIPESSNKQDYNQLKSGTVVNIEKDKCIVKTGKGLIGIKVLQSPNRKPLTFREFVNGRPINIGDTFEDALENG